MALIATASPENPHAQLSITHVDTATVNTTLITCAEVKTKSNAQTINQRKQLPLTNPALYSTFFVQSPQTHRKILHSHIIVMTNPPTHGYHVLIPALYSTFFVQSPQTHRKILHSHIIVMTNPPTHGQNSHHVHNHTLQSPSRSLMRTISN